MKQNKSSEQSNAADCPSYLATISTGRHNAASAKAYCDKFYSKSFFGKVAEDIEVAKAVFKSPVFMSEGNLQALQARKILFKQAAEEVKALRKRQERGAVAEPEVLAVYIRYSLAMNEVEACTDFRFDI